MGVTLFVGGLALVSALLVVWRYPSILRAVPALLVVGLVFGLMFAIPVWLVGE